MDVYWLEQAEADVPADDGWLAASEVLLLSRLHVPKRRLDWRLGRRTAKLAVATLLQIPQDNVSLQDIEILADASGAPWACVKKSEASLSISITHRAGVAACAVGPPGAALGCDLELLEAHSNAFVSDYFTDEEQALIAQADVAKRDKLVATLWSAKESALKALRLGLRADTRWVAVGLCDGWPRSAEEESAEEWSPLQTRYKYGQVLHGWWRCSANLTRTVVTDGPAEPPIRLTIQS